MFRMLRVIRKLPKISGLSRIETKRINFVNTALYLYEIINPWSIFARKPTDSLFPERRIDYLFYLIPKNKTVEIIKNRIVLTMYYSYKRKGRTSKYDSIINDLTMNDSNDYTADKILPMREVSRGFWW